MIELYLNVNGLCIKHKFSLLKVSDVGIFRDVNPRLKKTSRIETEPTILQRRHRRETRSNMEAIADSESRAIGGLCCCNDLGPVRTTEIFQRQGHKLRERAKNSRCDGIRRTLATNRPKRVENTFSNERRGHRCPENGRNFKSCLPARMEMSGCRAAALS